MTVCVVCSGCHTEIATGFSSPRNDGSVIAMTMCRCWLSNNELGLCAVVAILRLPLVASNSRNDNYGLSIAVHHPEIATSSTNSRNDDVWVLSLRGVKRRSNP